MKKFISGVLVGALLFGGASAFADSVGLIGQKVQGLFSIEKDGKKIAEAVVIKGTAYAPVRAVAEATGSNLTVEGKKIIMGENNPSSGTLTSELQAERIKIAAEITRLQTGITDIESNVLPGLREQAEILGTNGAVGERAKETVAKYEAQLQSDKDELTALQTQLAEIDAKIAHLSK
jgi:hypothetical protein